MEMRPRAGSLAAVTGHLPGQLLFWPGSCGSPDSEALLTTVLHGPDTSSFTQNWHRH